RPAATSPPPADLLLTRLVHAAPPVRCPLFLFSLTRPPPGPPPSPYTPLFQSLPAGLTFVGASSTQYNSSTGVWTLGSQTVNDTQSLTITSTVNANTMLQTIKNTATASADQFDPISANNSPTAPIPFQPTPHLH